jgi:hypothetical protein
MWPGDAGAGASGDYVSIAREGILFHQVAVLAALRLGSTLRKIQSDQHSGETLVCGGPKMILYGLNKKSPHWWWGL